MDSAHWVGAATQLIVRRIVDSRNYEYNFYQDEVPLILKLIKKRRLLKEKTLSQGYARCQFLQDIYLASVKYWGY